MDIGGGDDFAHLIPGRANKAASPAHPLVGTRRLWIGNDRGPGLDGAHRLARLAPGPDQSAAHHRVFDAARAVQVPTVRGAARATARLMVRHPRSRSWIISLLCFPGNHTTFDVNLPTASTRAVY